jgi:hypothetical protein
MVSFFAINFSICFKKGKKGKKEKRTKQKEKRVIMKLSTFKKKFENKRLLGSCLVLALKFEPICHISFSVQLVC